MNIKKSLPIILLVIMSVLDSGKARAQYIADRMAIHFDSPVSLFTKTGGKLEYRFGQQNSIAACYNRYWGFFPGYNMGLDYHRYYQSWGTSENFIYGKAGGGNAEYRPQPYYSGWEKDYQQPGKYLYAGAGVGRRWHWGAFFLELNLGLKVAPLVDPPKLDNYNKSLFYTAGPGSLVDLNMHFGFQFLHYKGSVSHITGTQRWRRYNY
jgi:hypothetical protein